MKDTYWNSGPIPADKLVPKTAQPDYADAELPQRSNWNIAHAFADEHVQAGRGAQVAAIHAESAREYSYEELTYRSDRLARTLVALGIEPGERVAYCTVNDPEFLVILLAIWKAGGIVVPIPTQSRGEEVRYLVDDTTPRFLFVHERSELKGQIESHTIGSSVEAVFFFPGALESGLLAAGSPNEFPAVTLPEIDPDQVAIVWHTGGTTGRPKGCYHTHRRFLTAGLLFGQTAGVHPGQRWTAAAPVGHALGLIHHTIYTVLNGATAVFVENYKDAGMILQAISACRISHLTALTASWAKIAELIAKGVDSDISSLERCYAMWQSASASSVFEFWLSRGVELLNNFGSTAFATWVLIPPVDSATPRSSLGRSMKGYRVEAVEVEGDSVRILPAGTIGQMAVKGPTGLTYWGLPEMQARDVKGGWTLCDDLIYFDDEGFAHYMGRTDFMISSGGFKVAPVEVEQALSSHQQVEEVAVVPGPCPSTMEMVVAFVVVRQGAATGDELKSQLIAHARAVLSPYKVPRRIEFVSALPRDAVGKVQTKIIKQWAYGER